MLHSEPCSLCVPGGRLSQVCPDSHLLADFFHFWPFYYYNSVCSNTEKIFLAGKQYKLQFKSTFISSISSLHRQVTSSKNLPHLSRAL